MKFQIKTTYGSHYDYDNVSPYTVFDGKWGGFGMQSWFRGIDKENPNNVFETASKCSEEELIIRSWYFRVFDIKLDKWRDLTKKESNKYRIPDRKYVKPDFSKTVVTMTIMKRPFADIDLKSIMLVQPMNDGANIE
jgi:hypothetical protein